MSVDVRRGAGSGVSGDAVGPADIADRDVQVRLLEHLRGAPTLTLACREVGVDYRSVLACRRSDPDFDREVEDARAEGYDRIEETAYLEAVAGGFKAHKLIEFLLKGRKRHIYGDRLDVHASHQHEVIINLIPPGEPVPVVGPGRPGELPEDVIEGELVDE